ncbi:unnamed protein product [Gemmata massiliana]|uniref:Uncharacterized protein n=1 Tax=Gemmata massiliana TaxID=1210884 RepID=A0A6P2CX52_9BACT|nr:hypothetical protein [Gemmata massiliana]VTR93529.1 unnamed protein product [Gemmata massiliana]
MRIDRLLKILEDYTALPAYVIIFGWAIRSAWQSNYETAALGVPLALGLSTLIEIRKQLKNELPTRRVGSFAETHSMIREAFEREVKRSKTIEIRILGQTMQSYTTFLKPLIQEIIDKNSGVRFVICIAMIDSKAPHLAVGLPDAAAGALKELKRFSDDVKRNIVNSLSLFTFKDAPSITGIAVNRSVLFLGMIKYKKTTGGRSDAQMITTAAGTGSSSVESYEMVRAAGGAYDIYRDSRPEDEERISLFIDSFDALCARSKKIV